MVSWGGGRAKFATSCLAGEEAQGGETLSCSTIRLWD